MKKLFVFGFHIGYSISPAICSAALRQMGLDWDYSIWDMPVEGLPEAVAYLRRDECVGANVTIPHKEAIVPLLDDLTENARLVQAANTVLKRDGRLVGDNTDGIGFMHALRDAQVDARGAHVVILGAGGAARGVAFALGEAGAASIAFVNRTPERARTLVADLRNHCPGLLAATDPAAMPAPPVLVVNSLPPSAPFDLARIPLDEGVLAFDLTYRPTETPFMIAAARRGARVTNGVAMLVYQGAASLRIWTGREPDTSVMFEAGYQDLQRDFQRE